MDWLSQNWIWIALGVGALFFITRMGGCGMGHSTDRGHGSGNNNSPSEQVNSDGTSFDPVSHRVVAAGGAEISSVYHGRAYHFENHENRVTFEGNPEKYLAGMPSAGETANAERDSDHQQHHRHGC